MRPKGNHEIVADWRFIRLAWLESDGVEDINNVNHALAARPWHLKFGVHSKFGGPNGLPLMDSKVCQTGPLINRRIWLTAVSVWGRNPTYDVAPVTARWNIGTRSGDSDKTWGVFRNRRSNASL